MEGRALKCSVDKQKVKKNEKAYMVGCKDRWGKDEGQIIWQMEEERVKMAKMMWVLVELMKNENENRVLMEILRGDYQSMEAVHGIAEEVLSSL